MPTDRVADSLSPEDGSEEEPIEVDETALRILNLLFTLNSSTHPLPTEQIISDSDLGYGSENRESDKRKFKRDRDRLAEHGIAIREIREQGSAETEESLWALDRKRTFADADALDSRDLDALLGALDGYLELTGGLLRRPLGRIREKVRGMARQESTAWESPETSPSPAEDAVWTAFSLRRKLTFLYESARGEKSKRTVAIYGLFTSDGVDYFTGLDSAHGEIRTFRIDRVVRAWRPKGPYLIPEDFDVRDFLFLPFDLSSSEAMRATFAFTRDLPRAEVEAITRGRGELTRESSSWSWSIDIRDADAAAAFALLHTSAGMRPVAPEKLVECWRSHIEKAVSAHERA